MYTYYTGDGKDKLAKNDFLEEKDPQVKPTIFARNIFPQNYYFEQLYHQFDISFITGSLRFH